MSHLRRIDIFRTIFACVCKYTGLVGDYATNADERIGEPRMLSRDSNELDDYGILKHRGTETTELHFKHVPFLCVLCASVFPTEH